MKLIELLEVINENNKVAVFDKTESILLSVYDGKNSISKKYNSCKVLSIETDYNTIYVCVDYEK